MVLPLYLAMTRQEMEDAPALPRYPACFLSGGRDLRDFPGGLPPGTMPVLTDRIAREDRQPLAEAVKALGCGSVLLDFEEKPTGFTANPAKSLSEALPCPLAAPPGFAEDSDCAVFLPPCPLHIPLADYLRPWQNREIWLDVTLGQETITVTREGTTYSPTVPTDKRDGTFNDILLCQCVTEISTNTVTFTLFDTPETLKMKLEEAAKYGVTRAVGLYQELHGKL